MATYQSSLIEALRNRPQESLPMSSVTFLPNPTTATASVVARPLPARKGIFNPEKLTMAPAAVQPYAPQVRPEEFFELLPQIDMSGGSSQGDSYSNGSGGRGGPMTAEQAMNTVALGRGLSDYGSMVFAPGSFAAGLVGNAMMGAGQNALSSLDAAMMGISPSGSDVGGYGSSDGWGGDNSGSGLGW